MCLTIYYTLHILVFNHHLYGMHHFGFLAFLDLILESILCYLYHRIMMFLVVVCSIHHSLQIHRLFGNDRLRGRNYGMLAFDFY